MTEQQSERRKEDRLSLVLQRQSLAISQLTKEIHNLKNVPQQLAILEYKLGHLNNMTTDINLQGAHIDTLNTSSTRHKTILSLMGFAIVILFPLVVTWNNQLRKDIAELQHTTIMLKERQERSSAKPSGITVAPYKEYSPRNAGEIIRL